MAEPEIAHPLFPNDDEDRKDDGEPIPVSQIQITRLENGQAVFAPRVRQASELLSLDQIQAELGGGTYILIARHDNRITTRRKYVIPGKSKPMYDEAPEPGNPTPAPAPSVDPMQAMMGAQGGGGLMGLVMMMMQQMMQQQAQAAQSQTQMFIAMMQGNQQSSSEEKAQARAELQANIERERQSSERTMALMREMMQSKGGNGSGEDFTRGVEFMRGFAMQQIELTKAMAKGDDSSELGSLLETLGQAFQAAQSVGMFKGMGLPPGASEVVEQAAQ